MTKASGIARTGAVLACFALSLAAPEPPPWAVPADMIIVTKSPGGDFHHCSATLLTPLIVAAVGASNGWLSTEWLTVLAIAMSLSFAVAACLSALNPIIYSARRAFWSRLQRAERLPDDLPFDIQGAKVSIIGMGGIGTGTYDRMREVFGETVVGVDIDPKTVGNQRATGRNVLVGDPADADFWDRMQATHTIELVMLALPNLNTDLAVLAQLKAAGFTGKVAAMAKFQDDADALMEAGATTVFNIYTEAGAGFAAHVLED